MPLPPRSNPCIVCGKLMRQAGKMCHSCNKSGPLAYQWKGDAVTRDSARHRTIKTYPVLPPCQRCGKPSKHRHHVDTITTHNYPSNIEFLCPACHRKAHVLDQGVCLLCEELAVIKHLCRNCYRHEWDKKSACPNCGASKTRGANRCPSCSKSKALHPRWKGNPDGTYPLCSELDCGKQSKIKGLCQNHYARNRKRRLAAELSATKPSKVYVYSVPPRTCAECHRPLAKRGLCQMHYRRLQRQGLFHRTTNLG